MVRAQVWGLEGASRAQSQAVREKKRSAWFGTKAALVEKQGLERLLTGAALLSEVRESSASRAARSSEACQHLQSGHTGTAALPAQSSPSPAVRFVEGEAVNAAKPGPSASSP